MKTKWTIASQEQSLALADGTIPPSDREAISLPDGDPEAIRLCLVAGQPERMRDGAQRYCAPWLICQ